VSEIRGVTSNFCSGGNCVEVTSHGDDVAVTDTKLGAESESLKQIYSKPQWEQIAKTLGNAASVADMEAFLPLEDGSTFVSFAPNGEDGPYVWAHSNQPDAVHVFTAAEQWDFVQGAQQGQFNPEQL